MNIGSAAFRGCTSLSLIHVMNGIHCISTSLFEGCSSLETIRIADDVDSIGASAFKDCSALDCIYIPESVHSIGASAFSGCESLTRIYVPGSIENIENNAFMNCSSLPILNLPDGVRNIGDSVFEGCSSMVSIRIPNSVTSVGRNVFHECRRLGNIIYNPKLLSTLDRNTKWSGMICNPFEGSLMSNRFAEMKRCPRCGGKYEYIVKEKKTEPQQDEAEYANITDLIKSAISKTPIISKALDYTPETHDDSPTYYSSNFYRCRQCGYKKYKLN